MAHLRFLNNKSHALTELKGGLVSGATVVTVRQLSLSPSCVRLHARGCGCCSVL